MKTNKTIALLRKLQTLLPRAPLITSYESFIRPHLDYGDIIYDQTFNTWFQQKIETIQCNGALGITNAIRSSSKKKNIPRIRYGDSSTTTLVQKTVLFLQNTKTTAYKVSLFNCSYSQYVIRGNLFHLLVYDQGNIKKMQSVARQNSFFFQF